MAMVKVFKVLHCRIRPDEEQRITIWKTFGCCRKVWNCLLDERIQSNKVLGGDRFKNTTPAHLKKEYDFLNEVDSLALANTQLDLNGACKRQFAKGKAPKFKRKGKDKRSYTTNYVNNNIRLIHKSDCLNFLHLPKLGDVQIILHRNVPGGELKHVTIRETASGKFFASLVCEVPEEEVKVKTGFSEAKVEAFDYSMPSLAVSASGEFDVSAEDIRWYRRLETKIAREERKLSHMKYGSGNYWKQKHKVGALHEKAANRRKDFLHKLSRAVADRFDAVAVEDINLQAMARALNFGKSVHDNGFGMFRVFLAYKLKAQGKILVKVNRFYPGSQLCSNCGAKNSEVKNLAVREWVCPKCGTYHLRDKNACQNLRQYAILLLGRWTSGDSSLILTPLGILNEKEAPTS